MVRYKKETSTSRSTKTKFPTGQIDRYLTEWEAKIIICVLSGALQVLIFFSNTFASKKFENHWLNVKKGFKRDKKIFKFISFEFCPFNLKKL